MTEVEKPVPADLLVKGKDKVLQDEPMELDLETGVEEEDEDLYTRLKTLQRQLEFYEIQVCTSCNACRTEETSVSLELIEAGFDATPTPFVDLDRVSAWASLARQGALLVLMAACHSCWLTSHMDAGLMGSRHIWARTDPSRKRSPLQASAKHLQSTSVPTSQKHHV